jgi:hypothetical protein
VNGGVKVGHSKTLCIQHSAKDGNIYFTCVSWMCHNVDSYTEDISLNAFNVGILFLIPLWYKRVILTCVVQHADLMRTLMVYYVSYFFSCMCSGL